MALATFLKINPADSVVVCLQPKKKGDVIEIDGKQITVNQDTPAGHKILIKDVREGEDIIKYGYPIGHARQTNHLISKRKTGHSKVMSARTETSECATRYGLCLP